MYKYLSTVALAFAISTPALAAERIGDFSHDSSMAQPNDGMERGRDYIPIVASKPADRVSDNTTIPARDEV
jgi:hypothetical protein